MFPSFPFFPWFPSFPLCKRRQVSVEVRLDGSVVSVFVGAQR